MSNRVLSSIEQAARILELERENEELRMLAEGGEQTFYTMRQVIQNGADRAERLKLHLLHWHQCEWDEITEEEVK